MAKKNHVIEQEVAQIARGTVYYPGGSGGGGSRRGSGDAVVLPHKKTSPSCTICHRYHTTAEHARHSRSTPTTKTTTRPAARAKSTKPTATKSANKKKPTPSKQAAKATPRSLVKVVKSAISNATPDMRYGAEKVYISDLWDKTKRATGQTLGQFKDWLVKQNQAMEINLARADLVGAMNRDKLTRSEIVMPDGMATFHFVVDPDGFDRMFRRRR